MFQRNIVGFHSAHGQSGHAAMRLISESAKVGVNIRNQFVNKNRFESRDGEIWEATATSAGAAGTTSRSVACGIGSNYIRSCGTARSATSRAHAFVGHSVGHHDDERPCLVFGDEVVHDQIGVALIPPSIFV